MQIYLFTSATYPNVRGFTQDQTGGRLPACYAPWQSSENAVVVKLSDDPVSRAIERDGFFLMTGVRRKNIGSRLPKALTKK
ncbi:MAG TPA: hypothetical protein VHO91_04840 [Rhodopila sp.]|nr:hypothetical protein [Rhodopila sp.]